MTTTSQPKPGPAPAREIAPSGTIRGRSAQRVPVWLTAVAVTVVTHVAIGAVHVLAGAIPRDPKPRTIAVTLLPVLPPPPPAAEPIVEPQTEPEPIVPPVEETSGPPPAPSEPPPVPQEPPPEPRPEPSRVKRERTKAPKAAPEEPRNVAESPSTPADPPPVPAPTPAPEPPPVAHAPPAPTPTPVPPARSGQGEVDLGGYRAGLGKSLARHKRYPKSALRRGLEGAVLVQVVLNVDGSLAATPTVVRSSNVDTLDDEALRMVLAAAPFPPLPGDYQRPTAKFKIPIEFKIEN